MKKHLGIILIATTMSYYYNASCMDKAEEEIQNSKFNDCAWKKLPSDCKGIILTFLPLNDRKEARLTDKECDAQFRLLTPVTVEINPEKFLTKHMVIIHQAKDTAATILVGFFVAEYAGWLCSLAKELAILTTDSGNFFNPDAVVCIVINAFIVAYFCRVYDAFKGKHNKMIVNNNLPQLPGISEKIVFEIKEKAYADYKKLRLKLRDVHTEEFHEKICNCLKAANVSTIAEIKIDPATPGFNEAYQNLAERIKAHSIKIESFT